MKVALTLALLVAASGLQAQSGKPLTKQPKVGVNTGSKPRAEKPRPTPERDGRRDRDGRSDRGDRDDRYDRDRYDRDDRRRDVGRGYRWGYRDGYWDALVTRGAGTPLLARLHEPLGSRFAFALNDAAYVAVFEIQPGYGTRLVFPAGDAPEHRLAGGLHEAVLPADGLIGSFGGASPSPPGRQRWLYMVASDRPLGLLPGRRAPATLENMIGQAAARGSAPAYVAQLLRQHAVTLGAAGTWTDALVSYVPGQAQAQPTRVRCTNGVVYDVRVGETFTCPA